MSNTAHNFPFGEPRNLQVVEGTLLYLGSGFYKLNPRLAQPYVGGHLNSVMY
jgi:hypothetical protein